MTAALAEQRLSLQNKDTTKTDRKQCLSVLDNPRADVYNGDKERRCPHNGQLPLPMS